MSLSIWSHCLRRNSNKVSQSSFTNSQVSVQNKSDLLTCSMFCTGDSCDIIFSFLYYQKRCLRQACLDGQKTKIFLKANYFYVISCKPWLCFSGNPAIMPKRILRTRWFSDPWTYGSYSNPAVGWSVQDLKNLREPLPLKKSKSQVPTFIEFHREYRNTFSWIRPVFTCCVLAPSGVVCRRGYSYLLLLHRPRSSTKWVEGS